MSKTKEWVMREGMDKMLEAEALIGDRQVAAVAQVMTAVNDLTQHLDRYHEEVDKLAKRINLLELAIVAVKNKLDYLDVWAPAIAKEDSIHDGNETPKKGTAE